MNSSDAEMSKDLVSSADEREVDDVEAGAEPGACFDNYLATVDDELDDLEGSDCNDNTVQLRINGDFPKRRTRTKSGTIKRIKKELQKQKHGPVEGLKHSSRCDSFTSSSDDTEVEGNSSASANVSETESDYESSDPSSKVTERVHSGSISDSVERLKLARTDSVMSESDPELEYVQSDEWKNMKKHIFVLSQSGKPIYCRYGNEDKLVTIYGVMQAIVSFVSHGLEKDLLKIIVAGERRFVFLVKEHFILVAVSSGEECVRHLQLQLTYIYNQILSMLTLTSINKIYKDRVNFDLRRMLSGTEKFLDNILTVMDSDTSYILGSVRCLPLNSSVRDNVTQTIVQCCNKVKDLVFAIIISKNQLVTLVRMKKFTLHPQDLHILLNLVQSSDSFKAAESWLPVCLPKFDSSGFLHAYVSYLDEPCNACLLLLTVDSEHFPILSECKTKIVERLNRYSCLQAIAESIAINGYNTFQVTKSFELYTVFSPLIAKHSAISSVNKLLKWMKREETRLFILTQTTF